MESGVKLPGPPGKAKYSSMTDSEPVGRLKGEKHSYKLSQKYLKPHTYKRSEGYALGLPGECLTAYLLHNGPASAC